MKSMLRRSSRGGVPVFRRPIVNPADRSDSASSPRRRLARAARGPLLVADVHQAVQKRARRDDERAAADAPAVLEREPGHPAALHRAAGPPRRKSHVIFGSASSVRRIQAPYSRLSACARGDQTAGPRLRLSSLN